MHFFQAKGIKTASYKLQASVFLTCMVHRNRTNERYDLSGTHSKTQKKGTIFSDQAKKGVEVRLHSFLTSALQGGEWST
jgi:hypothetical protein